MRIANGETIVNRVTLGTKSNNVEERPQKCLRREALEGTWAHRQTGGRARVDSDDDSGDKRNVHEHPAPPQAAVIR
jgi:hypothetical protein